MLSNNEFDGVTMKSALCNGNHYWGLMFISPEGDHVTLDRNYFHDQSGRAPKLGQDNSKGFFHATNNLFLNMKGHAFDADVGNTALIEGNVFESVNQPTTDAAAKVSTPYTVPDSSASSACTSALGRACPINSVDSKSGKLAALSGSSVLSAMAKFAEFLVTPIEASKVAAIVKSNAGPANLGSSTTTDDKEDEDATPVSSTVPAASTPTKNAVPAVTSKAPEAPATTSVRAPAAIQSTAASTGSVPLYGQFGGVNYIGATKYAEGSCIAKNDWYLQCINRFAKFRRAIEVSN